MRISDWSSDVCSSDLAGGDGSGDGGSRRRRQKNGRAHVRTRKDATSRTTNDQYIIRRPFAERGGKMTNSEIVRAVDHEPPFTAFEPTPFRKARPGESLQIEINLVAEVEENFRKLAFVKPNLPNMMTFAIRSDEGAIPSRNNYRSEEHTSELQSLMRISYAVFCLKKNNKKTRLP